MKAMLLCAGLGTRLRPITYSIPKPLVPVFDAPVVSYTIDILRRCGIEEAVVNLHHLPANIRNTLGTSYSGVHIHYSHEPEILGAVGGIREALPMLDDGPIPVINGDILFDIDLRAMLDYHTRTGAVLTLSAGKIPSRPELHVIGADAAGRVHRVRDLVSRLDEPRASFVNLGIFIYESRIIREYAPPGEPFGFAGDGGLISRLFDNGERVMIFSNNDFYWNDIGTPSAYLKAHTDALGGRGAGGVLARLKTASQPPVTSVVREPVYFGSDVRAERNTVAGPDAVIGSGSIIGKGACIKNSIVLPGSSVPSGASIIDSIVLGNDIIPVK